MDEKPKILIIEDDADLVAAMKMLLEKKGYQIFIADDPDLGEQQLKVEKPDLIILDVMFGSKSEAKGFDFANKMRLDKQNSSIPVLMLTSINSIVPFFNFSPETDNEFLPVDAFLDKPVRSEELFTKVEELLQQKTSKWINWPDKEA